jgi:hypothetical protein
LGSAKIHDTATKGTDGDGGAAALHFLLVGAIYRILFLVSALPFSYALPLLLAGLPLSNAQACSSSGMRGTAVEKRGSRSVSRTTSAIGAEQIDPSPASKRWRTVGGVHAQHSVAAVD